VILINEGTASSAEVFASALRDNGRTVALVGAKTYGKGLIQHTFPMPDGGGLRLTVAEYLTPALQHVTNVGGARYNANGDFVGGGIQPDVLCPSNQGIPGNVGADICVGMALDALEDAEHKEDEQQQQQQVNVGESVINPNVLLFLFGFIRRPGKSHDLYQSLYSPMSFSFFDV
jgi:C-terminal processing protease CtpA/Prc